MLRKLEILDTDTFKFLRRCGHIRRRMTYPRWDIRKYTSEMMLSQWRYAKKSRMVMSKAFALRVIGFQTFTGIRGEWVERND